MLEFDRDIFILCEGLQDKLFLEALILEHRLASFQIGYAGEFKPDQKNYQETVYGGRSTFKVIDGFSVVQGFSRVKGIMILTDNDNAGALPETLKILEQLTDYIKDETTPMKGQVFGKPSQIVLIPGDNEYGNLETFCTPVLYDKWMQSRDCVNEYLKCSGADKLFSENKKRKAIIRSLIAGYYMKNPGSGIGALFKESGVSTCHPHFEQLVRKLDDFANSLQI